MIDWISIKDKLPNDGQRCLIWDKNTHVSHDGTPETIHHVYMATFCQGEHRPNGPWRSCDTGMKYSNNHFPWCWQEGLRRWFSQDVTYWAPTPNYPQKRELLND